MASNAFSFTFRDLESNDEAWMQAERSEDIISIIISFKNGSDVEFSMTFADANKMADLLSRAMNDKAQNDLFKDE